MIYWIYKHTDIFNILKEFFQKMYSKSTIDDQHLVQDDNVSLNIDNNIERDDENENEFSTKTLSNSSNTSK